MRKIFGKSWKTSLFGWGLMIGASVTVFLGKASWTDAGVAIATGLGLLAAKDGDKK
jgi:hypothetical protein